MRRQGPPSTPHSRDGSDGYASDSVEQLGTDIGQRRAKLAVVLRLVRDEPGRLGLPVEQDVPVKPGDTLTADVSVIGERLRVVAEVVGGLDLQHLADRLGAHGVSCRMDGRVARELQSGRHAGAACRLRGGEVRRRPGGTGRRRRSADQRVQFDSASHKIIAEANKRTSRRSRSALAAGKAFSIAWAQLTRSRHPS